jgi:hypothetical protein
MMVCRLINGKENLCTAIFKYGKINSYNKQKPYCIQKKEQRIVLNLTRK